MQRRILVALALVGLLLVVLVSRAGAAPATSRVSTSPVTSSAGAVGTSTLVRSDRGIAGLPAGHAVTVW